MSDVLSSLRIPSFLGLQTNRDLREVQPGGAAEQVNVVTTVPGRFSVRKGIQPHTFDSTATLASGLNTFRRVCFCRSRFGEVFIVNGIDQPLRWDGVTAAAEDAGVEAPAAAPTVAAAGSGGSLTAGDYDCYIRYIDDTLPEPRKSNLSPVQTVTVVDSDKLSWTVPATIPGRGVKIELWRSTSYSTVSPNTLYLIATLDEGTTSYPDDGSSDATLQAFADENVMKILLEDGSLNANRFVPPPNDRPIMVMYQDRYWFGGQVDYNRGTVTTNGTTAVTGSGTDWTTEMADRYIEIEGEPAPIRVASVASATSLTLATAATTSGSSKAYVLAPDPSGRRKLLYSEVDEPESVPTTNTVTIQENAGDSDEITGLIPGASVLHVMTERHRHTLTFSRQPRIDAAVLPVDFRGLLNQFCWGYFDDAIFAMDEQGPYVFRGSQRGEALDGSIHDLWRDGTVDLSKKDKFFVQVDRRQERVYFFVVYSTDSGEYPTRALVYNVRTGTWDAYEYPQGLGGAAAAHVSGQPRLFLAGENSDVHLADEGTTDIVSTVIQGTATSASNTTLVDSSASFTDAVIGAPVYIYEGTGKGQRRTISARTSTQITVSTAWTTNPDTTSKYAIGAIDWRIRLGRYQYLRDDRKYDRSVRLAFQPTTNDSRLDLRLYLNYASSPEEFRWATKHISQAVYVDEANPSDLVVKMKSDESDLENKVGYEIIPFTGQLNDQHHTDRCVSVELRGFQAGAEILVDEIELNGVVGNEE